MPPPDAAHAMPPPTVREPVLEARGLEVALGGRPVLHELSLQLRAGELAVVVGPNGAGKTTLLRALAGVLPVDRGEVVLGGRPLAARSRRDLARELCYLPQETWTEFGLSVLDVVRLGRYPHLGALRALRAEDHRAVRAAMERADVADLAERSLTTLSGGERRRVFLARALAQEAQVLLFDEPTTALDVGHACAVMEMLAGWALEGRAIVVSLHDLTLAARGPNRAVLLHRGRILADGPPAEVLTGPSSMTAFGVRLVALAAPPAIVPA